MGIKGILPYQRLTTAEKIKEYGSIQKWGESVVYSLDGIGNGGYFNTGTVRYNIQVNLDLADGKLNPRDFEHIISEYRLDQKQTPNNLKNYPLIPNIIQELVGEKLSRPFNFRVTQTNYGANSAYDEAKKNKTIEMAKNMLLKQMIETGLVTEDQLKNDPESVHTPDDVERYMAYTWKDLRELMAQDSLNYLMQKLHIRYLFKKNFKNFLATGVAVFHITGYNNNPSLRVVNPQLFECDISPVQEKIETGGWSKEEEYITASEVYDRYYDQLTEEDIHTIENIKGRDYVNSLAFTQNSSVPIYYHTDKDNGMYANTLSYGSNTLVRVCHLEWASLRKIGTKKFTDEKGIEQTEIVDEDYKPKRGEVVEWDWINERWEATKIGNDIFVNIQPLQNQKRDPDNLSECYSNYIGTKYDYCLVDLLKSYQYLFNVTMFNFEKAMSLAKGKALLFDIAQIPTSHGFDLEKWIYYLQTANIAFINSAEETKRGDRASAYFNQFQALDMTMSNSIQYYVNILDKIEAAAQSLVGVTRQRLASVQASDQVGTTNTAIQQSSYITEHIFDAYEDLERRVLEALVETAKICWINGKKSVYVLDSGEKAFLDVDGAEFNNGVYGIFISAARKDQKVMQFIEQNAQAAIQAGKTSISAIAKLLIKDNASEGMHILEKSEQEEQQREQQMQDQQLQAQQKLADQQEQLQRDQMDQQYIIAKEKNINTLQVAAVNAMSHQQDLDQDNDGTPDQMEMIKFGLDQQKLEVTKLKNDRDHKLALQDQELKKQKLVIDKIKANKPTSKK